MRYGAAGWATAPTAVATGCLGIEQWHLGSDVVRKVAARQKRTGAVEDERHIGQGNDWQFVGKLTSNVNE